MNPCAGDDTSQILTKEPLPEPFLSVGEVVRRGYHTGAARHAWLVCNGHAFIHVERSPDRIAITVD
jgi:hypothetical protein